MVSVRALCRTSRFQQLRSEARCHKSTERARAVYWPSKHSINSSWSALTKRNPTRQVGSLRRLEEGPRLFWRSHGSSIETAPTKPKLHRGDNLGAGRGWGVAQAETKSQTKTCANLIWAISRICCSEWNKKVRKSTSQGTPFKWTCGQNSEAQQSRAQARKRSWIIL